MTSPGVAAVYVLEVLQVTTLRAAGLQSTVILGS